jgi:PAS domain S-box-containing protein
VTSAATRSEQSVRQAGAPTTAAVAAKRRVRYSLFVLLVLLVAVVATGLFATYNLYRSAEDRYVKVAFPLQTLTRDVLFQMAREESGVRGYMITTNRRSLKPYTAGRQGVTKDLAEIEKLTRGRPSLARRLRDVQRQVVSLHGFYDRLITFVADGQGLAQAKREVLDGEQRAQRFRRTALLMQGDIAAFVSKTRDEQHATYVRTLLTLTIAGLLALAVAGTLLFNVPERLRVLYAAEEEARQRAEQGANASRALEHVSDAVLLVDDDGAIRFWNEAASQLFGVAPEAAVSRRAAAIVPDYDRLLEAAEREDRFVPVRIGGDEHWLSPALSRFDGGTVLAVRDATAGYVLERARTDFVATASHELRTPLTTVYGGARTLIARGDQLTAEQSERLLRMIEQESDHLVQIVDQLLVSAQLDRGSLHLDESTCDVAALCEGVVESARVRAPSRITLDLDTPDGEATIRCDESLLRQVVVNLVENAIKYSNGGGHIEVRVSDEPARVRIDVQDDGPGIPPSEQERIFEKFYRLDASMMGGVGGSGLGLYISREIVTQMGGTLSVRSQPGTGSTFTVSLPRRA